MNNNNNDNDNRLKSDNNELKLKIKTILNDDMRVFKRTFNDIKTAFEAITTFIIKSYQLNNLNNFILQYIDDENDLITMVDYQDLNDALQQSKIDGKTMKIYVNNNNNNNNNVCF